MLCLTTSTYASPITYSTFGQSRSLINDELNTKLFKTFKLGMLQFSIVAHDVNYTYESCYNLVFYKFNISYSERVIFN